MSFKYSAIGDNTKENREHLERLGYIDVLEGINYKPSYILTIGDSFSNIAPDYIEMYGEETNAIDCRNNDLLFRAVTAIREDTDEDQWFTNGKEWIFCDREDWIDMYSVLCSGGRYNYNKNGELDKFFKATLAELQEHFK